MPVNLGRILIIGGGICGLTAAIALRKRGFEAVVYEQSDTLAPIGSGISLWPNALRVLRKLGLADAVLAAGARVELGEILEPNGRQLSLLDAAALERETGEPLVGIHRGALQSILEAMLPPECVVLGARLAGIQQVGGGVEARFADGTVVRGDLLIGADGLHSRVRKNVQPDVALRYAGYCAFRGLANMRLTPGRSSETWGTGARFGLVPVGPDEVYWFATLNAKQGETRTPDSFASTLRSTFGDWHTPIPALIDATPVETILCHDLYDIAPLPGWHKGRVVLAGDAAHPTTPNMGQGACMAMESALVLARCLGKESDLETALTRYVAMRKPRTTRITKSSRRIGRMGQYTNPLACRLRNAMMRLVPGGFAQGQVSGIVSAEI